LTHKANENFFAHKREWSKRKDEIIGCYLPAYLPKIMTLKKPVVIVDGFAGPGKFDDGEAGSPLIICDCISQTFAKKLRDRQDVKLICVETIPTLYERLETNLAPFAFATAKPGKFSDYSGDISRLAESRSVFLYVDPFTVEGLIWADLEQIYRGLELGNSVEILLNLNSGSFIRRGLAALKLQLDEMDDENEVPVDVEISETPQIEKLDAVAGGKWWQHLIAERKPFPETVHEFTVRYCRT
jgi:three-Cys-motif partner protein